MFANPQSRLTMWDRVRQRYFSSCFEIFITEEIDPDSYNSTGLVTKKGRKILFLWKLLKVTVAKHILKKMMQMMH